MDVSSAIKQRLTELGLEQRDLARAAEVTESYVSQLLSRRRLPPAPHRTDIYEKMERVLNLPLGEIAKLATHERKERVRREWGDEPTPLFGDVRELILRKCAPARARTIRAIFEKEPFGELERLITKTILDVAKGLAKSELGNEHWLRTVAKLSHRSFREMRVVALEFLDTDILDLSPENCVAFLDPLIKSWDIDLPSFEIEIELNPKVSQGSSRRFRFAERPTAGPDRPEPGLVEFLQDRTLSGSATKEEIDFLKGLRFTTGQPTALYFYRELQSLRDPLHFHR